MQMKTASFPTLCSASIVPGHGHLLANRSISAYAEIFFLFVGIEQME
jgi:hypothetical protein